MSDVRLRKLDECLKYLFTQPKDLNMSEDSTELFEL